MTEPEPHETLDLDADLDNADWTKRTWDLPCADEEELREFLARRGMTVRAFKRLPVYRFNRDKLPWLRRL